MFLDSSDAAFISGGLTVLTERQRMEFERLKSQQLPISICKPKSHKIRKGSWAEIKHQVLARVKPTPEEEAKYQRIVLEAKKEFGYPESHWKK